MELSSFNARKRAEDGVFMPLLHPYTKEPIGTGDDAPGFLIRGNAARSVQARMAEMRKKAQDAAGGDDEEAMMEALHKTLIDAAMRYIIEARNIENDGKLVKTEADIRGVLDMTFPEMETVKDPNGNTVMVKAKDKDGNEIEVPRFDLANLPFAKQVIDAAEDGERFLGATSKG